MKQTRVHPVPLTGRYCELADEWLLEGALEPIPCPMATLPLCELESPSKSQPRVWNDGYSLRHFGFSIAAERRRWQKQDEELWRQFREKAETASSKADRDYYRAALLQARPHPSRMRLSTLLGWSDPGWFATISAKLYPALRRTT